MKIAKGVFRQEALSNQERRVASKKVRPARPQPFLRAERTGST